MHSSQGSGAFTDFGANVSMGLTDRLRVGAQFYDRNLGNCKAVKQWVYSPGPSRSMLEVSIPFIPK